jgi:hypothetical protein
LIKLLQKFELFSKTVNKKQMSVGVQDYPSVPQISAGLMDIPSSMLSDSQPRLVASQVRQVQLPSQSGDQAPGGVLNFQISTGVGQGYMKRGSCYLRTKIVIKTKTALPTSVGAKLWSTALNDKLGVAFGGPLAQASQVINRLTLLSGGQVLEQINNYHQVANVVNCHAASAHYLTADHKIYENAMQWINTGTVDSRADAGAASTLTITMCIPLLSGLLQSQHHLPLFLLTGNVQLQLDLNVLGAAFLEGGDANGTQIDTVSFQNNSLMYEQLSVDAVMEATLKQSLMRAPFAIPFNSFVSLAASVGQGTVSQPIGLNLSSVYGVLVAQVALPSEIRDPKYLIKNSQNSIKLFADGRLINSHMIDVDPLFFVEMNKVFNLAFDPSRTSALATGAFTTEGAARSTYDAIVFASGVCTTRVSEDGVVMTGSPVNQMLVELQGLAGAATAYYIVPHQLILTIDVAGTAAIIR